MYATDAGTPPAEVTVPAPTRDNPAAGTTGNPSTRAPYNYAANLTRGFGVPAGVLVWTLGGLAVVVGIRGVFRNGGVA